jgi:hypothetical protein
MVTKMAVDVDPNVEIRTPRDPNTLSNYHNYVTKHTSVDSEIDFARKRLVGKVGLRMESLTDESVGVVLDSRYVDSMLKLFSLLLRLACIHMGASTLACILVFKQTTRRTTLKLSRLHDQQKPLTRMRATVLTPCRRTICHLFTFLGRWTTANVECDLEDDANQYTAT